MQQTDVQGMEAALAALGGGGSGFVAFVGTRGWQVGAAKRTLLTHTSSHTTTVPAPAQRAGAPTASALALRCARVWLP